MYGAGTLYSFYSSSGISVVFKTASIKDYLSTFYYSITIGCSIRYVFLLFLIDQIFVNFPCIYTISSMLYGGI